MKWNPLRCAATDGDNVCVGQEIGLVGQIYKTCENVKCSVWFFMRYSSAGNLQKIFESIVYIELVLPPVNVTHS